jgi:hypothetical protein
MPDSEQAETDGKTVVLSIREIGVTEKTDYR